MSSACTGAGDSAPVVRMAKMMRYEGKVKGCPPFRLCLYVRGSFSPLNLLGFSCLRRNFSLSSRCAKEILSREFDDRATS